MCYSRYLLTSYFCIPVSYDEKEIFFFFLVLVLEGFAGLHRTVQLQLLQLAGQTIDLDYCDIEWFVLETNRDHSVAFEIATQYCISDFFVDYIGYSMSSEGFLPAVIGIMVI